MKDFDVYRLAIGCVAEEVASAYGVDPDFDDNNSVSPCYQLKFHPGGREFTIIGAEQPCFCFFRFPEVNSVAAGDNQSNERQVMPLSA